MVTENKEARISFYGQEGIKLVEGKDRLLVRPFVGMSRLGNFGVGVDIPEIHMQITAGSHPYGLISEWRAMRLIEEIDQFSDLILVGASNGINRRKHGVFMPYLHYVTDAVGPDKVMRLVEQIFNQVPTNEQIEKMLDLVVDKPENLAVWELKDEIEGGWLASTPRIEAVIREQERRWRIHKAVHRPVLGKIIEKPGIRRLFCENEGERKYLDGLLESIRRPVSTGGFSGF